MAATRTYEVTATRAPVTEESRGFVW